MTVKEAKEVFAHFMSVSRERKLTTGERSKLRTASQLIRHARRTTAANVGSRSRRTTKPIRKSSRSRASGQRDNPGKVLIYDKITRIEGTKGKGSSYAGQKFFHNFKRPYPKMYGLPDGSLLIK